MTSQPHARIRLAVDIGGTFTDVVLALPGRMLSAKLLTTHAAPDEAVIAGTQAILHEAGIAASSLDLVIHGTTLATNALIERKGARCALVTTAGFRDSLEIAYEHRFEQYDLYMSTHDRIPLETAATTIYHQAQAIIADAETPVVDGLTTEAEYNLKYWQYVDDGKTLKVFLKNK